MPYPADSDVWTWVSHVSPAGARDATLWGFAYAAKFQDLPNGTAGLANFQAFQNNVFNWIKATSYWDSDFLLAYIQANGDFPNGPGPFTSWLAANGYAKQQSNGSYAKTGVYPTGGAGYPPGGAATASATGSGGGTASAPATAGSIVSQLDSLWSSHPFEIAVAGGVLGILFLRGR